MSIYLSPTGATERDLPPIWNDGDYDPTRIGWYVNMCLTLSPQLNGTDLAEFIAAMILESSLDNLIIGNNAKNNATYSSIGIGWCQLDTAFHVNNIENLHLFRSNPEHSFRYVLSNDDLTHISGNKVWFNKQRWNAWWDDERNRPKWENLDPIDAWSPYEAALKQIELLT